MKRMCGYEFQNRCPTDPYQDPILGCLGNRRSQHRAVWNGRPAASAGTVCLRHAAHHGESNPVDRPTPTCYQGLQLDFGRHTKFVLIAIPSELASTKLVSHAPFAKVALSTHNRSLASMQQPPAKKSTLELPLGRSFIATFLIHQEVLSWINPPWPHLSLAWH